MKRYPVCLILLFINAYVEMKHLKSQDQLSMVLSTHFTPRALRGRHVNNPERLDETIFSPLMTHDNLF